MSIARLCDVDYPNCLRSRSSRNRNIGLVTSRMCTCQEIHGHSKNHFQARSISWTTGSWGPEFSLVRKWTVERRQLWRRLRTCRLSATSARIRQYLIRKSAFSLSWSLSQTADLPVYKFLFSFARFLFLFIIFLWIIFIIIIISSAPNSLHSVFTNKSLFTTALLQSLSHPRRILDRETVRPVICCVFLRLFLFSETHTTAINDNDNDLE